MKIIELGKCLFCGKRKTWKSDIHIVISSDSISVTVCPNCRKIYPISDIYERVNGILVREFFDKKRR